MRAGLGWGRAARAGVCVAAVGLTGCARETRELRLDPPVSAGLDKVLAMPNGVSGAPPQVYFKLDEPYTANAWQLGQGKRLYEQFNCKGCHGEGGGMSGPALIDGWWRWGPEVHSIYLSIRDGRPAGMPAYRERLTVEQMWQLAGYVQTIGAYAGGAQTPGRFDTMHARPAENRAPAATPPLVAPSRR